MTIVFVALLVAVITVLCTGYIRLVKDNEKSSIENAFAEDEKFGWS